jgi:hypothetical protein
MLTVATPAGYPLRAIRYTTVDVFLRVGYCDGMMPRAVFVVLGTFLLVSTHLRAQTTADPDVTISTDRPAVTNSSVVVPRGALQVEIGFLATDTEGRYVLDFPESYLRYGLLDKTELRFTAPDYFQRTSPQSALSGFGDAALGVKQQLGPLSGFDLSGILFLSLPTGAKEASSHGYDPGLSVCRMPRPDRSLALVTPFCISQGNPPYTHLPG